jgi:hypothetical protein
MNNAERGESRSQHLRMSPIAQLPPLDAFNGLASVRCSDLP